MHDGRSVEITAKKPEDAIKQGLEQLGVTLDDVRVEVLETGGLFRKAKVRLTVELDEPPTAAKREAEKPTAPAPKAEEKREPVKPAAEPKKSPEKKDDRKPADKRAAKSADKAKKSDGGKTERTEKPAAKKANGKNEFAQASEHDGPALKKDGATAASDGREDRADRNAQPRDGQSRQDGKSRPRKLREEERQALERALEFVKLTIEKMGFDADVEADSDDPEKITVTAADGDDSLIIGRHGETLSALSYLAETAERAEKCKVNVTVDCNGYRARRAASLTSMARRRAKECVQRRRKIKLEPMDRVDRRTVHFALSDNNRVTTASEGKEPYRCVVIFPTKDERRRDGVREDDGGREVEEYEE